MCPNTGTVFAIVVVHCLSERSAAVEFEAELKQVETEKQVIATELQEFTRPNANVFSIR